MITLFPSKAWAPVIDFVICKPPCRSIPDRYVTLYEHVNLKGSTYKLPENRRWTDQRDCNHPDLSRQETSLIPGSKKWDKSVSSLKLDPDTSVKLFKGKNFTGEVLVYRNPSGEVMKVNSLPSGWNDQVASIQVNGRKGLWGDDECFTAYPGITITSLADYERYILIPQPEGLPSCRLEITGALDDHYNSTGSYNLAVSVNGTEVYPKKTAPFEHGKPFGKVFNNWKTLRVDLPGSFSPGTKLNVKLTHSGSPRGDWIGIDYLMVRCGDNTKTKELSDYKNYGVNDRAAGIVYGGQSKTWTISTP
jgi:hypothetical protein